MGEFEAQPPPGKNASKMQSVRRRRRQRRRHPHEGSGAFSGEIPTTGSSRVLRRNCLLLLATYLSLLHRPDRVHAGRWMNIAHRGGRARRIEEKDQFML